MRIVIAAVLCFIVWLCGGCQIHGDWGEMKTPYTAAECQAAIALKDNPEALRAFVENRGGLKVSGSAWDMLGQANAGIDLAYNPATGTITTKFTRGNDVSAHAAEVITATGHATKENVDSLSNLAGKLGAGVATGGGSTMLDTLVGAAVNDPALLETAQRRLDAVRKLTPPKIP